MGMGDVNGLLAAGHATDKPGEAAPDGAGSVATRAVRRARMTTAASTGRRFIGSTNRQFAFGQQD
jgi:hypothetical protein